MDAAELRAKLAALAEFDVTEYTEGELRIVRSIKPKTILVAAADAESAEPEPVVIPSLTRHADWGARSAQLDDLAAELDRVGA